MPSACSVLTAASHVMSENTMRVGTHACVFSLLVHAALHLNLLQLKSIMQLICAMSCINAGMQSTYRPLDIFSFSTCEVASPASSSAASQPASSLADSDTYSKSLLMTSSGTKGTTVQLVQKSVKL